MCLAGADSPGDPGGVFLPAADYLEGHLHLSRTGHRQDSEHGLHIRECAQSRPLDQDCQVPGQTLRQVLRLTEGRRARLLRTSQAGAMQTKIYIRKQAGNGPSRRHI